MNSPFVIRVPSKQEILYFFLFFAHMSPSRLIKISGLFNTLFDVARVISCLIIIYLYIRNKRKPTSFLLLLICSEIWLLVTTFINGQSEIKLAIITVSSAIAVAMGIEMFSYDRKKLVNSLMLIYEILIYVNFVSVIKYPSGYPGERNIFFLGSDNTLILYLFPAIFVALLYMEQNRKYLRGLLLCIISAATILINWSATSVVALFGASVILVYGLILKRNVSLKALWIITFCLSIFMIFFFASSSIPFMDYIITSILGKNSTLTGRVYVWETVIELVKKKFFIGYGFGQGLSYSYSVIHTASHAHNEYLQQFFQAGLIGFILFVIQNFVLAKKIDTINSKVFKIITSAIVFGLFITYITEAYLNFWRFYFVFALAFNLYAIGEEGERL